jgi:hypothetical protein
MTLYFLLLAHLLYDFHWQGEYIATNKKSNLFILAIHALTWAMLLGAVLCFTGEFSLSKVGFLFVSHFVIDLIKCRAKNGQSMMWLYIDQSLHFVTMLIVALHEY